MNRNPIEQIAFLEDYIYKRKGDVVKINPMANAPQDPRLKAEFTMKQMELLNCAYDYAYEWMKTRGSEDTSDNSL